ncbi:Hypothetical protein CGLY_14225 [Corynebacterium glyciniphilum AJ 3170]|uniref:Uncharacterized protein n=1 Tax=Corynebacterium glyciniphilum AJ 3170 TaxID=1404245 RepID=X5ED51_9CORY|nr:hypothetical protein [Corynebacterium glyciniphilum]AHW65285.1 Hypothetical protein CGLY_14225 [Corynebacterium glyciniphilum AJ 3170]
MGDLAADVQIWLQADSPDHHIEAYLPTDQASADALTILKGLAGESASQTRPGAPSPDGRGPVNQ